MKFKRIDYIGRCAVEDESEFLANHLMWETLSHDVESFFAMVSSRLIT